MPMFVVDPSIRRFRSRPPLHALARLLAVATMSVAGVAAPTGAQSLDLDPTPRPPALDGESLIDAWLPKLREEIGILRSVETSDETVRSLSGAMRAWRELALELILRGEATQPPMATAIDAGLRLVERRRAFDETLTSLAASPATDRTGLPIEPEQLGTMIATLRTFGDGAVEKFARIDPRDTSSLDGALATVLGPVEAIIRTLDAVPSWDPWRIDRLGRNDTILRAMRERSDRVIRAGLADSMPSLDQALAIAEDLAEAPATTARGIEDAALLERALRSVDPLDGVPSLPDSLGKPALIEAMQTRLAAGLADYELAATRNEGRAALAHAAASGELALAVLAVDALDPAGSSRRRSLVALASSPPRSARIDALAAETAQIERIARLMRRSHEAREGADDDVSSALRSHERRLLGQLTRVERRFVERAVQAARMPDGASSPEFVGLVRQHEDLARDVVRVRRLAEAAEPLAELASRSGGRARRVVARLASGLVDPLARAATVDRVEALLARVDRIGDEIDVAIQAPDPVLDALLDDRASAISLALAEARTAWADALLDEDDVRIDQTDRALTRLERLLDAVRQAAALGIGEDTQLALLRLERFAPWSVDPATVRPAVEGLGTRCRLITAAVLEGEPAIADRQLDAVEREAAVARLAGTLLAMLPTLDDERLPTRLGTTLRALATAAPPGVLDDRDRALFAELGRWSLELQAARAEGRRRDAEAIIEHVDALARTLLRSRG